MHIFIFQRIFFIAEALHGKDRNAEKAQTAGKRGFDRRNRFASFDEVTKTVSKVQIPLQANTIARNKSNLHPQGETPKLSYIVQEQIFGHNDTIEAEKTSKQNVVKKHGEQMRHLSQARFLSHAKYKDTYTTSDNDILPIAKKNSADFSFKKSSDGTTWRQDIKRSSHQDRSYEPSKGPQWIIPQFKQEIEDISKIDHFKSNNSEEIPGNILRNVTKRFTGGMTSSLAKFLVISLLFFKGANAAPTLNTYPQPAVIGTNVDINCIPPSPLSMSDGSLTWLLDDGSGFKTLCINEKQSPEAVKESYSCIIEKTENNRIIRYTLKIPHFSFLHSKYVYRCDMPDFLSKSMSFSLHDYSYNYIPKETEISVHMSDGSAPRIVVVIENIFPAPSCRVDIEGRNVPAVDAVKEKNPPFYKVKLSIPLEDKMRGQTIVVSCLFANEWKQVFKTVVPYCRNDGTSSSKAEPTTIFILIATVFVCRVF